MKRRAGVLVALWMVAGTAATIYYYLGWYLSEEANEQ